MRERLASPLTSRAKLRKPWLLGVGTLIGFIAVVAAGLNPPDPESRLPSSYRLAALIERQQNENEQQRAQVNALREQVDDSRKRVVSQEAGSSKQSEALDSAAVEAGTVAVEGEGFVATLDDSSLSSAPTGNVNDLVIHSQDVQAVVNGMWASGAEAVAINGQRVVTTSAILCVGNTLLLNGTVHSPPYEISAIGANRSQFQGDLLVRQLKADAERFSLRFSIGRDQKLELPAYTGVTELHYAQVSK